PFPDRWAARAIATGRSIPALMFLTTKSCSASGRPVGLPRPDFLASRRYAPFDSCVANTFRRNGLTSSPAARRATTRVRAALPPRLSLFVALRTSAIVWSAPSRHATSVKPSSTRIRSTSPKESSEKQTVLGTMGWLLPQQGHFILCPPHRHDFGGAFFHQSHHMLGPAG